MSYLIQSRLAADGPIRERVTACAAAKGIQGPDAFAYENRWVLSSQPGWVAAYAAATGEPGADESAVTDAMILAAVEAISGVYGEPVAAPVPADPMAVEPEPEPNPSPAE